MPTTLHTAVFGGGCFWCTEATFQMLKGVHKVTSGYAGGTTQNPTYEQVSSGTTGHAEVIKIDFDPSVISFSDLLTVFFNTHDPTTVNRQGADVGTQYRSAIFYSSPEQREVAEKLITELNSSKAYENPVVTEVAPLGEFYEAEEYHKDYYKNNSSQAYCQLVIAPKLEKMQKRFAELLA
ncbi:MAG: peptide-methionine (S)-S-oxide reductase MsrA [Patescibacteria group bacterium]